MPRRATGEALGQDAEAGKGESLVHSFTGVSTGKARQGIENSLGLASLNNSSRLWL